MPGRSDDRADPSAAHLRAWFWAALAATTAIRAALAVLVPLSFDEAYFAQIAQRPSAGFYEHGPTIVWLLAPLVRFTAVPWVLRIPAIVSPIVVALVSVFLLRAAGARKAHAGGLVMTLAPTQAFWFPVTNDVPLVLFSFLSLAAFVGGLERRSLPRHAMAGAFLGLAVLSKYLAGLLAVAYLAWALLWPRDERSWRGPIVTLLCAAPFVALSMAWNYEHCWTALRFVYTRHHGWGSWWTAPVFAMAATYVCTPVAVVWAVGAWRRLGPAGSSAAARASVLAAVVPLSFFAALSPMVSIYLFWLNPVVLPLFLALAMVSTTGEIVRAARWLAGFFGLHVIAMVALVGFSEPWRLLGLEAVAREGQVARAADELILRLSGYLPEFELATTRGGEGYLLAQRARANGLHAVRQPHLLVFGPAAQFYREFDGQDDLSRLEGRDILVVTRTPPPPVDFAPFFASIEHRRLMAGGMAHDVVLGRGFKYEPYRRQVLTAIGDRYYRLPAWLPIGRCPFCERYFGSSTCPVDAPETRR